MKLHTSEKFGTVITYTNNHKKKRVISTLCCLGTIICIMKDNKHSLLTLFIIGLDVCVAMFPSLFCCHVMDRELLPSGSPMMLKYLSSFYFYSAKNEKVIHHASHNCLHIIKSYKSRLTIVSRESRRSRLYAMNEWVIYT